MNVNNGWATASFDDVLKGKVTMEQMFGIEPKGTPAGTSAPAPTSTTTVTVTPSTTTVTTTTTKVHHH